MSVIHVCLGGPIYEFCGFVFEWHPYCGPMKLRKTDLEPAQRVGYKFYAAATAFAALPADVKRNYLLED